MSYDQVKKAMAAGTPHDLICASCPWDRLCVTPPALTAADIEAAVADAATRDKSAARNGGEAMPAQTLMTAMIFAGRDTAGALCPVFATRLRGPEGRQVSDSIRSMMQAMPGSVTQ